MLRASTIGRKDTRIEIQKRTASVSAVTNQHTYTYSTLARVWAEELGPISNERYEASQNVSQNVTRFRVSWSRTLEENMDDTCVIVRDGETLHISGIERIGRRSEYVITAGKRDNG